MNLGEELRIKVQEHKDLNKQRQLIADKMKRVGEEIEYLKKQKNGTDPVVTDHAVLRMLERKYQVPVEKVRTEILSAKVKDALKVGAKKITVDGATYVLGDNTVITIIA